MNLIQFIFSIHGTFASLFFSFTDDEKFEGVARGCSLYDVPIWCDRGRNCLGNNSYQLMALFIICFWPPLNTETEDLK